MYDTHISEVTAGIIMFEQVVSGVDAGASPVLVQAHEDVLVQIRAVCFATDCSNITYVDDLQKVICSLVNSKPGSSNLNQIC